MKKLLTKGSKETTTSKLHTYERNKVTIMHAWVPLVRIKSEILEKIELSFAINALILLNKFMGYDVIKYIILV